MRWFHHTPVCTSGVGWWLVKSSTWTLVFGVLVVLAGCSISSKKTQCEMPGYTLQKRLALPPGMSLPQKNLQLTPRRISSDVSKRRHQIKLANRKRRKYQFVRRQPIKPGFQTVRAVATNNIAPLQRTKTETSRKSGLLLDVSKIYGDLDPGIVGFNALFKRKKLPSQAYLNYREGLDLKIDALKRHVYKVRFHPSRISYKEKVSKRRRLVKKEWIWGESDIYKMRRFYQSFRKPTSVYEYKVVFSPIHTPQPLVNERGKKIIKTKNSVVFYMYKKKGESKVYIIDPEVFINYVY